jgi:hypothetical protein
VRSDWEEERGTYALEEFLFWVVVHQSAGDACFRLLDLFRLLRCRAPEENSVRFLTAERERETHLFGFSSPISMSSSAPSNLYTREMRR